jgi:hypothetical protein
MMSAMERGMNSPLHIGDIVKYRHPQAGEETLTFVLIEHNGDRVLIESRDFSDYRIAPREVVATADIVIAEKSPTRP